MFTFLALRCLLYLFLTMSFCLHSYCIHQILDSVSYAHQHDIVHRDLKVCVFVSVCALFFIFLHLSSPCVQHLLFTCSCSLPFCLCLRLGLARACCPSIYLSLFSSLACLPVFRLCTWDCFCTISDGLKEKPESLQTPHLDACESGL